MMLCALRLIVLPRLPQKPQALVNIPERAAQSPTLLLSFCSLRCSAGPTARAMNTAQLIDTSKVTAAARDHHSRSSSLVIRRAKPT